MKLNVDHICMGVWSCTDENYSGEPEDLSGIGDSPMEAVQSYLEARNERQGEK